jgi:hypothetical protein
LLLFPFINVKNMHFILAIIFRSMKTLLLLVGNPARCCGILKLLLFIRFLEFIDNEKIRGR